MYAILQQSGHQYRVSPGDRLLVDRLTAEVGSVVALEPVVLLQGDDGVQVGTPVVDGVRVAAVVVGHPKGGKIRVFKYKPKKHYRRTHGHRSLLTELRIEAVLAKGEKLPEARTEKAEPKAPARKRTPKAQAPSTPTAEIPAAAAVAETETATPPEAAEPATPAPKTPRASTRKPKPAEAEDEGAQGATPAPAEAEEGTEAETPKRRTRAKKTES